MLDEQDMNMATYISNNPFLSIIYSVQFHVAIKNFSNNKKTHLKRKQNVRISLWVEQGSKIVMQFFFRNE